MALGHQKLREHLDTLTAQEVRNAVRAVGRDLRVIRDGLKANST